MVSQRQHEENRRNAARSHGPTTPEGRASVRRNALKPGLTASEIILPTVEEKIDFEQFGFDFIDECQLDGQARLAMIFHDDAQDCDTLGKMARYEARFERTFYKALKELQRPQALRAEVSDSGNGTVSPTPISPGPDPVPAPETVQPQASARGTAPPEIRHPKSEIPHPPPQC